MIRLTIPIGAVLLLAAAPAQPPGDERTGNIYELAIDRETSFTFAGGGTGTSTDRDTMIERVLDVGAAGLELEYDLPANATREDREIGWQFPTRVLKPATGPLRLLNADAMAVRLDRWLKLAKLPRAACGHYYFTWNAFKVECDPQSVLPALEALDLRPQDLRDGGSYRDPDATQAATFRRIPTATGGTSFVAEMALDSDTVRRDLARQDIALGEISRKPVTPEAALEKARATKIDGSIAVTFDVDTEGDVRRRTTVTKLTTTKPDGKVESRTTTETIDRRLVKDGAT